MNPDPHFLRSITYAMATHQPRCPDWRTSLRRILSGRVHTEGGEG